MTMNDIQKFEFGKLMANVAQTYHVKILPSVIDIYVELLKEYTINDIKWSLMQHMKESSFMPKPADLLKHLKDKRDGKNKELSIAESNQLQKLREIEFSIAHAKRISEYVNDDEKGLWLNEVIKFQHQFDEVDEMVVEHAKSTTHQHRENVHASLQHDAHKMLSSILAKITPKKQAL